MVFACLGLAGVVKTQKIMCKGFAPENNLNIPVSFKDSGITEDQWTALFDKYEKIYTPIIASRGGKLILNRKWTDGTVNANAQETGDQWTINMFGGLARYPTMTIDGMALVVCHETGHHLGGAPRWYNDPSQWAANEGGADYFATLKCAHHMFADDNNSEIVSQMSVEPTIQKNCGAQYTDANEVAICQRVATAGIVLGRLLGNLSGETLIPGVDTPDTSAVTDTITDGYPSTQCRLDTYASAILCKADLATFQDNDYHTGSCTQPNFKVGLRPTCWFKPNNSDTGGVDDPPPTGGNGPGGGGSGNGGHNS